MARSVACSYQAMATRSSSPRRPYLNEMTRRSRACRRCHHPHHQQGCCQSLYLGHNHRRWENRPPHQQHRRDQPHTYHHRPSLPPRSEPLLLLRRSRWLPWAAGRRRWLPSAVPRRPLQLLQDLHRSSRCRRQDREASSGPARSASVRISPPFCPHVQELAQRTRVGSRSPEGKDQRRRHLAAGAPRRSEGHLAVPRRPPRSQSRMPTTTTPR